MNTTIFKRNQGKFTTDLRWNLTGFVITASSGLLINILIVKFLGFEVLGFFNISLALYLILTQISSFGVHLSLQRYIPQFSDDNAFCKVLLQSGLFLNLLFSMILIAVLIPLKDVPGRVIDNELLHEGFVYSFGGILFMTLNKGILAFLNGMRFMKSYAVFNAFRLVLMLIFLIVFILLELETSLLPLIFTIPEFVLFMFLLFRIKNWLGGIKIYELRRYLKLHWFYGKRVALGNILISLNPKVDILILGIFVAESLVGVYSFALFVSDGFTQLFYVFRNNINPIITRTYYSQKHDLLRRLIKIWKIRFFKIFLVLGVLAGLLYPIFLIIIDMEEYFLENLVVFYGLLFGVLISSRYMPFQFIFNQTGRAKEQTRFFLILFILTILIVSLFVWVLSLFGAVVAFILLNLFQVLYLKKFIKKPS